MPSDCRGLNDCCDCGGNECGCAYCFSCNACESCLKFYEEATGWEEFNPECEHLAD